MGDETRDRVARARCYADAASAEIGEPVSRDELAGFLVGLGDDLAVFYAGLLTRTYSVRHKPLESGERS